MESVVNGCAPPPSYPGRPRVVTPSRSYLNAWSCAVGGARHPCHVGTSLNERLRRSAQFVSMGTSQRMNGRSAGGLASRLILP